MTPERWRRVKDAFFAAVDQDAEARGQILRERCGEDAGLLDEVRRLLAADERATRRFPAPAPVLLGALDGSRSLRPADRLGAYRIVREIGHGGMGTVFLAERADDEYRKQVAVKVVRGGLATAESLRRFRHERQLLAQLDHPNIARLLDGGTTPDGDPYLVMEYVDGEPIDSACDDRGLGVKDRVGLFRQVCAAVVHAHQKLIIHRDLKPANILVTKEGEPKLLDFGIAKLFEQDGVDGAPRTETELRAMTPEYASPEQVLGRPVSTTSDVYSLGVLLYELLSGESPYRFESRTPFEVSRVVLETEPERPSAVAGRAGGADARRRARQLRGDLDTIVLSALRKDPSRRTASVERLDEDLSRYLSGLPVRARPDTLGYRFGKFVRRHRLLAAAAALLALTLAGGVAATVREARIAERRARDVRTLASSLIFELHDKIQGITGATKARELLVSRALEYLGALSRDSSGDPGLLRDLATAYERIGDIQGRPGVASLGQSDAAIASYDEAVRLRRELLRLSPGDARAARDLASGLIRRGQLLGDHGGRLREAIRVLDEAVSLLSGLHSRSPLDAEAARDLGVAYMLRGDTLGHPDRPSYGDAAAALESYRKGRAIQERLHLADPKNGERRHFLAAHVGRLAALQWRVGEGEEAGRSVAAALSLLTALQAEYPKVGSIRRDIAWLTLLSAQMAVREDRPRSLKLLGEAESAFDALSAADPANAAAEEDRAAALSKEAELVSAFDAPRAAKAYERALPLFEKLLAQSPGRARLTYQVARAHAGLAVLLAGEPARSRGEDRAAQEILLRSRQRGNMDRRVVTLLYEVEERLARAAQRPVPAPRS